jgi:hypothetical protein
MKFNNQHLSQQEIVLTDDEVNVLGPELALEDCLISSSCTAEALVIAGLRMKGGVFDQRSHLSNYHFERAHFDGVSFVGSYAGCDFGDWDSDQKSSIVNCDFTNARLDGCRFLRCKPETIRFPKWPCFTIVNPGAARQHVLSQSWPGRVGSTLGIYTDADSECVAITGDAERIANKNMLLLPDFRGLLMKIPGILITESK